MGIFDIFRRETKESAAYRLHMTGLGDPRWMTKDFGAFAKEGYQKNVVAYQAINRICDAVASIEWMAWRGETELTDHPILDLMRRPNPSQGQDEFWRAKVGYLLIAGNGYDERVVVGGKVREVWTLRPDRMSVVQSQSGMPGGYVYRVGGQKVDWSADPITGDSDIRHAKLFHPTDDWYGLSPIEAGAFAIDQHNEAMTWMQALLQNSARPSGALVTRDDGALSPDQYSRLKAELEENYQGARNAGRPMLLEGVDWKSMGLSPADMSIIESKYSSARDVSLAFGVPPMLLGIPGDNTYANYKEARLAFWEDTVLPLVSYLISEWNEWLSPLFGGVEIRPDLDKIVAIAEKRQTMWEMADRSLDLTVNEVRAIKGYEPLPPPLGDTLMAELKRSVSPAQAETKSLLSNLAYGNAK